MNHILAPSRSATAGNIAAAKLILRYAVGEPLPPADPDRLDLDEWKLLDQSPTRTEAVRAMIDGVPVASAIRFVQDAIQTLAAATSAGELIPTSTSEGDEDDDESGPVLLDTARRLDKERHRRIEKK